MINNHDDDIYTFLTQLYFLYMYITQINKMNLFDMGKHSIEHMKISLCKT